MSVSSTQWLLASTSLPYRKQDSPIVGLSELSKAPVAREQASGHYSLSFHWSKKGHFIFPTPSLCPAEVTACCSVMSLCQNHPPNPIRRYREVLPSSLSLLLCGWRGAGWAHRPSAGYNHRSVHCVQFPAYLFDPCPGSLRHLLLSCQLNIKAVPSGCFQVFSTGQPQLGNLLLPCALK